MNNLTYEKRLIAKAARSHTPINGSLELLPLCNMNCDMCYVRLSRSEMERQGRLRSAAEWISLARQMQKAGTLFLLLTGGEPLLFPDFKALYLELRKMGMILTINTNGTLMDEAWSDFLLKIRRGASTLRCMEPQRRLTAIFVIMKMGWKRRCTGFAFCVNGISMSKSTAVSFATTAPMWKLWCPSHIPSTRRSTLTPICIPQPANVPVLFTGRHGFYRRTLRRAKYSLKKHPLIPKRIFSLHRIS